MHCKPWELVERPIWAQIGLAIINAEGEAQDAMEMQAKTEAEMKALMQNAHNR